MTVTYPLECDVEIRTSLHVDAKSKIWRRPCRTTVKRVFVGYGQRDQHPEVYDRASGRFIASLETRLAIPGRRLIRVYDRIGGVLIEYGKERQP